MTAAPSPASDTGGRAPAAAGGAAMRFIPIPITTAPACCSARMPASLPPPASTSFGHFSRASTPAAARTAAAAATPASSGSQPLRAGGTGSGRSSTEQASAAPGTVTQPRASRPRPAVCASAASTVPSGAPPAAAASRSALVDPVDATMTGGRHRPAASLAPSRVTAAIVAPAGRPPPRRVRPAVTRTDGFWSSGQATALLCPA